MTPQSMLIKLWMKLDESDVSQDQRAFDAFCADSITNCQYVTQELLFIVWPFLPLRVASSSNVVSILSLGKWMYLITLPLMKMFFTEL